jgi:LmbE family N-acetylglucosaminyl deacetylase
MNVLVIAPHPDDETIGCGGALCLHAVRGDRVTVVFLTSGELGLKVRPRKQAWKIRESEARAAGRILGVARFEFFRLPDWTVGDHIKRAARLLSPILRAESPEMIYLPHPRDWHPDHRAATPLLRSAWRDFRLFLTGASQQRGHRFSLSPAEEQKARVRGPLLRGGSAFQSTRELSRSFSKPEVRTYEVWTPLSEYDHVEDISRVMPRKLRALHAHRSQLNEFDYERAVRGLNQFRGALAAKCPYAEVFQTIDFTKGS